jgi:hypothetical protein
VSEVKYHVANIVCSRAAREPLRPARDRRFTPSAQLGGPHPVDPLGNHDLGMLAIADIAAENTRAALPTHRLAGMPSRAYRGWPRSGEPLGALTCLLRLASM